MKPSLNYYQTLHVGKVKTDVTQFTTIQGAIDAITDNAVGKRYAVYVHPGTYAEQIVMEDYIDVIAIGGREETIITHLSTGHDQITVTGENAMLKGFTIVSDGDTGTFRTRCVSNALDGFEMADCVLSVTAPAAASVTFIATASCDMRGCEIDTAATAATAVSLDTATEDYNIDDCKIGGATTSVLVNDADEVNINKSTLYNLFDHDDCTTATTVRYSVLEAVDFDGGTINIHESYIETIAADTGGTVTAYGGTIRACSSSGTTFIWWLNDNEIQVIANMTIANALAAAASGDTIKLGHGTWAESNLVMADGVDIVGEGNQTSLISTGDAVNPIVSCAVTSNIHNVTIQNTNAGAPAVTVTANTLRLYGCVVDGAGSGITMTAGACYIYETYVSDGTIDLGTANCAFGMYNNSRLDQDPINTGGAFDHTLTLVQCDLHNQNVASAATGATTMDMRGCSNVGQVSNAGTGAFTIRDSDVGDVTTTSTGDITVYGGDVGTCAAASAAGAIVWWKDTNLVYVLPAMLIAHAVAAASAGDTIMLGQGTWTDSNLAPATGVDIVGQGKEISIIDASDAANPVFAIGNNVSVTIRDITIDNDAAGGAITISPIADNSALVIEDCDVINAGVSDCVAVSIGGVGSGTLTARRTDFTSDNANSVIVLTQTLGAGLLNFNSDLCNFTTSGGAANAAIEASAAVVATVNVKRATFSGCTLAVYSTGANHNIDIDESDFINCGIELAGNVPAVRLQNCYDIGAFAHSVACTISLRGCQFASAYTIGAVAGVVNAYRTQFAAFTNGGSGAIAFEECNGTDVNNNSTSTMTIEGGNWGTVLQAAAAGTINIKEAIVDTELDCSAGGAINAYNCQVDDIDSNGGTITLYGGDLQAVSDATGVIVWWETPHRLSVIASTANMKIMDAADAAAAGDLIVIGPGTFTEALDLDAAVNACTYRGMGRDKTTITQVSGNTVLVNRITGVVLEDMTIVLSAATDGDAAVKVDAATVVAASASVILRNVAVDTTGVALSTVYGILAIDDGTQVATVEAHDCYVEVDTGGTANYGVAANTCTTATSTISLYNCIVDATEYDIYNNYLVCDMHECELRGGGAYIANNAGAVCLVMNNEPMADVTPVVFAGAAGVFADISGCELWTVSGAAEALYEWVYVSAADTVDEADADGADTHPAIGVIVYKPSATTAYVLKHGYLYKPGAGWNAGKIEYLDTTAGQETETRPSDAVIQILGVAKNATAMLVNVGLTDAGLAGATKWLNIPIAWGAGSAPTGTHVDGFSRRACAIALAGQNVFSQAVTIPEDFQALSKLIVTVFGTTTGTFDWTGYSSAASNGEDEATHNNDATANGQAVTDDTILDHDITEIINRAAGTPYTMVQGDIFSCEFDVDALGAGTTQLIVLGFRMEYIPTK